MARRPIVAVFGGGGPKAPTEAAHRLGRALAQMGVFVLTGGRGGVMKNVSKGVLEAGGHTIGILPWASPEAEEKANKYVEYAVYTGLGEGRNYLNALLCDAAVAMNGGAGTLSEIGLAMKLDRPLVYLGAWRFLNHKGNGFAARPWVEDDIAATAAVKDLVQVDPAQTWAERFAEFAVPGQEENLRLLREQLEAWDGEALQPNAGVRSET